MRLVWEIGGIGLLFLVSGEVLGGPTQPALSALKTSGAPSQFDSLVEIAPNITDVEIKKSASSIEVFLTGEAKLECYDLREFVVQKEAAKVMIVPRFRSSKPDHECQGSLKTFHAKVADLDPANSASYHVRVLGYLGWIHRDLEEKAPTP